MKIENEFTVPAPDRPRLGLSAGRRAHRAVHARRRAHRDDRRPHLEGQGQHEARAGLARRSRGRSRWRSATTPSNRVVLHAKGMEQKGKGAANAVVTSWLEPGEGEGETLVKMIADIQLTGAVAQLSPRAAARGQPQAHRAVRRVPAPEHGHRRGGGGRRVRGSRPKEGAPGGRAGRRPSRSRGSGSASRRSGRRSTASSGGCSASAGVITAIVLAAGEGSAVRRDQADLAGPAASRSPSTRSTPRPRRASTRSSSSSATTPSESGRRCGCRHGAVGREPRATRPGMASSLSAGLAHADPGERGRGRPARRPAGDHRAATSGRSSRRSAPGARRSCGSRSATGPARRSSPASSGPTSPGSRATSARAR